MSKYAKLYRGSRLLGVISAKEFGKLLIRENYEDLAHSPFTLICPNPECNARLAFYDGKGIHFGAGFKGSKHCDECDNCCSKITKINTFSENDVKAFDVEKLLSKLCRDVSFNEEKATETSPDNDDKKPSNDDSNAIDSDLFRNVFAPKTAVDIYEIVMANEGEGSFAGGIDLKNKMIGKYSIKDLREGSIDIDDTICTVVATGNFPGKKKVPGKKNTYYDPDYEGNSRKKGYRIVHGISDEEADLVRKFRDPYKASYNDQCIYYIVKFASKKIYEACFKNKKAYNLPVLITGKWQKETFKKGYAYTCTINNPKQFVLLENLDETEPAEVKNLFKLYN